MGIRGARTGLVGAVAALALAIGAPASAHGAPYPVRYDFTQGILAQAASPDSPPPGANDWSCDPSAEHPRPVVLVPGLFANQTDNWQTNSPLLANHGYCVFTLTYGTKPEVAIPGYQPGGITTMVQSAEQLSAFVDRVLDATGAARVDIVGHSEGSLMRSSSRSRRSAGAVRSSSPARTS